MYHSHDFRSEFDIFGHVSIGDLAQPDWDIPRPVATCRHLLQSARLHRIDAADCLAGTGVTPADIDDSATEVQASQELAILRNILGRVKDPHEFARDVGLQYNFANTGVFGYALLASPTLGDAVNMACRYATLASTFLRLTRRDTPGGAVVEFDDSAVPADVRNFMLERDLFALTSMVPLLVGQLNSDAPIKVELPGIDIPAERLEFPGMTIELDLSATRSAVTIPFELLALPMPAADPAAAEACAKECEELLQTRRRRRGIAAQVRSRLVRDPGVLPSMAVIADELCITERTLRRRLAAEHTSYRGLVDEVRVTLAVVMLDSGLTVEETARQLGYSETAAFSRAFIRWMGTPPSRHRGRRP